MPDINDAVALGVAPIRPPPTVQTPDIVGSITSLAQLEYLQQQGALAGANAQFRQGTLGEIQNYQGLINSGTPPEEAVNSSGLGAYDPQGSTALLNNIGTARQLEAKQAYAGRMQAGDPNAAASLAPGGPDLVKQGYDAMAAAYNASSAQGDATLKQFSVAGQIANGVISAVRPDGSIDPFVRKDAVQQLVANRILTPQQGQLENGMPDQQVLVHARAIAARAQGAQTYAETSGQVEANKNLNTPYTLDVGQTRHVFNNSSLGAAIGLPGSLNATPPPTAAGLPSPPVSPTPSQPGQPPVAAPAPAAVAPPQAASGPNYYGLTSQKESGGRFESVNPVTGDSGLYNFNAKTAANVRANHPELGLSPGWQNDPRQVNAGMQAFTSDNARSLASNGIAVNDKNLYLAHFLGDKGAVSFIKSGSQNPDAPAAMLFPEEAKANPTVFYSGVTPRTMSQVYSVLTNGYGNGLTANNVPSSSGLNMAPGVIGGTSGVLPEGLGAQNNGALLAQAALIPPILQNEKTQAQQTAAAPPAPAPVSVAPINPSPTGPASAVAAPPPGSIPQGGAQPVTPGAVSTVVGGTPLTISQKAELEGQGKAYGELPGQLDEAASAAKATNQVLDQLQQAANGSWQPGKWAPVAENVREIEQSVGKTLGLDTDKLGLDQPIANYQDFVKTAGNLLRAAAHETSSRVGVMEMQLIQKSLPGPEVSDGGLNLIIPQMKGLSDFTIAKQQANAGWRAANNGSSGPMPKSGGDDFQAYWNKNASPAAFVFDRMLKDNPEGAKALAAKMATAPGGAQAIQNLKMQIKWAKDAGLIQ